MMDIKDIDISDIAWRVIRDGQKHKTDLAYARPYLEIMRMMTSIKDQCGADTGQTIILYFLENYGSKTEVGKEVRAELKRRLRDECGYPIK